MGASGLIYAEATRRQHLASWVGAHIRMLEYFHGSAALWVPDQLKSGVSTASRYEPWRRWSDVAITKSNAVCAFLGVLAQIGMARPRSMSRQVLTETVIASQRSAYVTYNAVKI